MKKKSALAILSACLLFLSLQGTAFSICCECPLNPAPCGGGGGAPEIPAGAAPLLLTGAVGVILAVRKYLKK